MDGISHAPRIYIGYFDDAAAGKHLPGSQSLDQSFQGHNEKVPDQSVQGHNEKAPMYGGRRPRRGVGYGFSHLAWCLEVMYAAIMGYYTKMFEKSFLDPMKTIVNVLQWNTAPVATLDDLF